MRYSSSYSLLQLLAHGCLPHPITILVMNRLHPVARRSSYKSSTGAAPGCFISRADIDHLGFFDVRYPEDLPDALDNLTKSLLDCSHQEHQHEEYSQTAHGVPTCNEQRPRRCAKYQIADQPHGHACDRDEYAVGRLCPENQVTRKMGTTGKRTQSSFPAGQASALTTPIETTKTSPIVNSDAFDLRLNQSIIIMLLNMSTPPLLPADTCNFT